MTCISGNFKRVNVLKLLIKIDPKHKKGVYPFLRLRHFRCDEVKMRVHSGDVARTSGEVA